MKCNKCNQENPKGSKFCSNCGAKLTGLEISDDIVTKLKKTEANKTIMELHPEYNFVPRSVCQLPYSTAARVLFVLLTLAMLIAELVLPSLPGSIEEYIRDLSSLAFFIFVAWVLIVYLYLGKKAFPTSKINNIIDYIQCPQDRTRKYLIFASEGKLGIWNFYNCSIQIPAEYDRIEWKEYARIIKVWKNDETFLIEINGKRLK